MPSDKPPQLKPPTGGVFEGLAMRIKLILRLMADRRVNFFLKILPLFTLAYLFIPDLIIGPLDDAAVIWIGLTLFVELCPADVVEEHTRALHAALDRSKQAPSAGSPSKEEEIIEGEYYAVGGPEETWDNGYKNKNEDH